MLSVVWPQQPLYCWGMPEHLVCYNSYLKACHIASHEEEIYNSLHHYISIPQNVRSTRADHNTNKEVSGHHTTYDYVWWMWPIRGHVSTTSSFLIEQDQDFILTTCHPTNASTSYSPIRCRSDSSASWKSTICRTDLDIQTLMSKVSTIGWRKYSFMAAWRRLLRSTPWKHCWYLPSNRTLSYNSYFILIKIHIIVMSVFPVSFGDNVELDPNELESEMGKKPHTKRHKIWKSTVLTMQSPNIWMGQNRWGYTYTQIGLLITYIWNFLK